MAITGIGMVEGRASATIIIFAIIMAIIVIVSIHVTSTAIAVLFYL
jgi:hypothetical protein